MSDLMIPISILIAFTLLIGANIFFRHKNKKEVQITIRKIIDQGGNITPEVLAKLGSFKSAKALDLRRSLVLIALGIACAISGLLIERTDLAFAIAVFPLLLGIALLISWKINKYED